MRREREVWGWGVGWLLRVGLATLVLAVSAPRTAAQSFAADDLRILARVLSFVQPPLTGTISIAYVPGNSASRADAEAIAHLIGDGIHVGSVILRPQVTEVNSSAMAGAAVIIPAMGANGSAIRAAHALCVTNDLAAVEAGACTVAIRRQPRVEIIVNHAAAAAAGIEFATAFRMMVREI